ncbi:Rnf-Nqr domain containing protein [Pseudomonas sp. MWU13-2105]|uniref:Rnf-Nqr domain containing protein n=1 Tax=Pseudomonas sp. MWU13-2105 TaxID=2935074 RepID=UPI00200C1092|nr:Rnf-Nqr domain containing protein [Pseudomonas sp. MWU13-2105]
MNRPALLQGTLVLTPLLGASDSLLKAFSIGLLSLIAISAHGLLSRLLKLRIHPRLAGLSSILLAASLVSCLSLGVQAWAWELHQALGIYPALIGLQCLLLERLGAFERSHLGATTALLAGLVGGLLLMGALRELLGNGTLLDHLRWLVPTANELPRLWAAQGGLHLASLTPGAFILLGLLLAARQAWKQHRSSKPNSLLSTQRDL